MTALRVNWPYAAFCIAVITAAMLFLSAYLGPLFAARRRGVGLLSWGLSRVAYSARFSLLVSIEYLAGRKNVRAMYEIGRALPEDVVVVVDESITALLDVTQSFRLERPGDFYAGRGGGIGQGVAGALGVKVAHPDRPVVAVSGDGSAMYSIQAL